MTDHDAIESFIDKWRARWPEWGVAEVFVPHGQRPSALAWAALLQELTDAAWGGSDPRPGEAKLGWWVEELQGWSRGIRRHPLGVVLCRQQAPWEQLAAALPALHASRERPVDADDARAQLAALAQAADTVDRVLFATGAGDAGESAVLTTLLHMRLAHHPGEAAPLGVLAQAGAEAAVATWTAQLAGWASARSAARPRRVWAGLARARLRAGEAARPVSAPRALWAAWRAARREGASSPNL